MLFAAICLVGVIFSILGGVVWFRNKNIIEGAVMGIVMWFFIHILVSMGLFVIDKYTVFRAGCGAAAASFAVLVLAIFLRRSKPFRWKHIFRNDMSVKDMLIPLIVSLLALPLVTTKNEFFGMGQDQGVYQTQAILFMNGDTKRQKDITEYHDVTDETEKAALAYNIRSRLAGYDIPHADYPDTVYDRSVGPSSGIIHGIPTYSALLAMWGSIFGMEHMQDFETILFVCLIFVIYFITRSLKLKKTISACVCALTAVAPVIIWTAKSSLTEIMLTLIPAVFLYFMTDEDSKQRWMSIIPVAVFGCYHVSLYTMLPMFIMIYGGMYVFTRERQYAVLMPVTVAGYLASFFMMKQVQPFYTMNNYSPLFVGGIGVHNITTVVIAVSAAAFVAVIIFDLIVKKLTKKDFSQKKFLKKASSSKLFALLLRLMIILPCAYIIIKAFMTYSDWKSASYVTLWGFCANVGFIVMPLAMVSALIFAKLFAESQQRLVVFIMFFYCILIYSAFLRFEVRYYFYFSRYLAPFIPVGIVFSGIALDRFGGKLLIPAAAASFLFIARYDAYLVWHKDDTRIEWSVLSDLADFVDADDCVVISNDYASRLWLPIRSMTGAHVIPEDTEDPDQLDRLAARYGRVMVITDSDLGEEDYTAIYSNKIHHIEDDMVNTGTIIPMPKSFYSYLEEIHLFSYDKYRFIYTAAGDYTKLSGVSGLEATFCWTDSEEAQVECGLYPGDYDVTLEMGCGIPFEQIGKDKVEVTLLLNGEEIGTQAITQENNGQPLHFSAEEDQVLEGENILEIRAPLWSASLANPNDDRELGIAFSSVRFSPAS